MGFTVFNSILYFLHFAKLMTST